MNPASRRLNISQPALSAQIKTFEGHLGEPLFLRNGKSLELTDKGQLLYGYARQMFEISTEMMDQFQKTPHSKASRIEIGISDEVDRMFAAGLMGKLFSRRDLTQQPRVKIVTGHHTRLMSRLREGSLDALITVHSTAESELIVLQDIKVPVHLVVATELLNKLKVKETHLRKLKLNELFKELDLGLVAPSDELQLRAETDRFLEREGITVPVVFESDFLAAMVKAVADKVGVAFVPSLYLTGIDKTKIKTFGKPEGCWKHGLFLMTHERNMEKILVKNLREAFKEIGDPA